MLSAAVAVSRGLADPTRLRILHLLNGRHLCVGDMATILGIPQPTASRRLMYLRRVGLVATRENSCWTFYSMAPAGSELHRRVVACQDADKAGAARDARRLATVRKSGGCCPMGIRGARCE